MKGDLQQAAALYCQNNISINGHIVRKAVLPALPFPLTPFQLKVPHLVKEFGVDLSPSSAHTLNDIDLIKTIRPFMTAAQRKRLDAVMDAPDFVVHWVQDWAPSAKVLVGAV